MRSISLKTTIGIDWDKIDSVVIVQDKIFGDASILLPVIESLLEMNPALQVMVYTPQRYHHFLSIDPRVRCRAVRSGLRLFLDVLISQQGLANVFLDFQPTLRYRILAKLSGARVISGLVNQKRFLSIFDTHPVRPMVVDRLQCESNLDVLRRLGRNASYGLVSFRRLAQGFRKPPFFSFDSYIVVHAGSRWMFKSLGESQWLDLVKGLTEKYDATIVLTGGDSSQEVELASRLASWPNVVSCVGETSSDELIAIIRDSIGFIGVDTFASHLAAFLDVPGVVVFGPTNRAVWGPHRSTRMIAYTINPNDYPCRPCNQDGCGGSKVSQCLRDAQSEEILGVFQSALSNCREV